MESVANTWDNRVMSPAARIVLVGVLFATGGALIKVCEVPALQRAAMRALIAAITIFALVPATRRRPDRHVLKLIPAYFGTNDPAADPQTDESERVLVATNSMAHALARFPE